MKQRLLLFLITLFCSCSEIIDNAIPEPDNLEIGIKNSTTEVFKRIEITTKSGLKHVFQVTDPDSFSDFQVSDYSYSDVKIVVNTKNNSYTFSPLVYNETTKVDNGLYYYDISIQNSNLNIVRHKF